MKGSNIEVNDMPEKVEVELFWKKIWENAGEFNENVPWLEKVKNGYCINASAKEYTIDQNVL